MTDKAHNVCQLRSVSEWVSFNAPPV